MDDCSLSTCSRAALGGDEYGLARLIHFDELSPQVGPSPSRSHGVGRHGRRLVIDPQEGAEALRSKLGGGGGRLDVVQLPGPDAGGPPLSVGRASPGLQSLSGVDMLNVGVDFARILDCAPRTSQPQERGVLSISSFFTEEQQRGLKELIRERSSCQLVEPLALPSVLPPGSGGLGPSKSSDESQNSCLRGIVAIPIVTSGGSSTTPKMVLVELSGDDSLRVLGTGVLE